VSSTPPGETSSSPRRPTAADVELLAVAQQFELAARELYDLALAAGDTDGGDAGGAPAVFATIRENHDEYASALSALIGVAAPHVRDDATFEAMAAGFDSADAASVAATAYELESAAVANHLDFVGQLESAEAARVLTSLLLVESQHCTVLADLAGDGSDLAALLYNPAVGAS
jgi:hypothetical protein